MGDNRKQDILYRLWPIFNVRAVCRVAPSVNAYSRRRLGTQNLIIGHHVQLTDYPHCLECSKHRRLPNEEMKDMTAAD